MSMNHLCGTCLADRQAQKANCTISGSGNINLAISDSLNIAISGSGNVFYKGEPTIVKTISGSGESVKL